MRIKKELFRVSFLNENNLEIAFVSFPLIAEKTVDICQTYVNENYRGLSLASKLLECAYEVISDNHYMATVSCSYAIKWFEKNPTKKDILV